MLTGFNISAVAADAPSAEQAASCEGRAQCRIIKTVDAGKNVDGAALTVLHLALGAEKQQPTEASPCRPYPEEYWLKISGKDDKVSYRRLFAFCNDGYGAAGVGQDEVTVDPNRITLKRLGGSAWRWETQAIYQLDPEQPLSRRDTSYQTAMSGCLETETSFKPLMQRGWLTNPPLANKASEKSGCDRTKADSQFLAIPQLADEEQGEDLAASLAKQAAGLGSCALTLNAAGGDAGFIVYGNPNPQAQTEIRLLALTADKLLVQVRDPGRTPTVSGNWSNDDRLELWLGPPLYDGTPLAERKQALYQFGIRLADGAVFAGYGEAERLPVVRRWRRGEAQVLLLDWSETALTPESVTVVYGQGDGQQPGLMVATSTFKHGNPDTLGQFWTFPAQCEVQDGLLNANGLQSEAIGMENENTAD